MPISISTILQSSMPAGAQGTQGAQGPQGIPGPPGGAITVVIDGGLPDSSYSTLDPLDGGTV